MVKIVNSAAVLTITPVSLLEIIEVIGEASALILVKRFGGTTPRLPVLRNITDEHPLAQCIGVETLILLVTMLGGGRWLYIPRCARGLRAQRNREIVRRYSDGEKVDRLVGHYHLSDRQIWTILGSTAMDDQQTQLF